MMAGMALIGALAGIVAGLFGVGGGLVFVPLLVIFMGFDTHLAIGTSFAAIIPTAIPGLLRHLQAGHVDWKTALILTLFSVLGAWIGAGLSLKLDVNVLRKVYSVFLFAVALKLFFRQ